jgi:hypothetical protein
MKLLTGKTSDILLDYADGIYTLNKDSTGRSIFVDESGEEYSLSDQVVFYLGILHEQ